MMVGCFVSDQDGDSHADPWADGQRWVDEDWYGCRQKAVDEGSAIFVMEYGQGYTQAGHASCGHMNVINHGNFHVSSDSDAQHFLNVMGGQHAGDTGHNGFGRAPLEDCTGEIDDAGHALGNAVRCRVGRNMNAVASDCLQSVVGIYFARRWPLAVCSVRTARDCHL